MGNKRMEMDGSLMVAEATWTITPITLGRRMARSSWFNYLEGDSEPLEIAYRVWLLRNKDNLVLVDTGPPVDEASVRGITDIEPINKKLLELSVDPLGIRHIVLTHLHWDHASSADQFLNAHFYAQKAEIDFFVADAWENNATARFYSHRSMLSNLIHNNQIVALDGDVELCPGLRLIKVGGHTPGSQVIAVDTEEGVAVLTGDAIPMNRNYIEPIPTGILVDLISVINARKLVRSMNPHSIYTGHDPVERYVCK